MKRKKPDEHGKNPAWQVPMHVATAGKGAYDASYESAQGRINPAGVSGNDAFLPESEPTADPAGKALRDGAEHVHKQATQQDRSG